MTSDSQKISRSEVSPLLKNNLEVEPFSAGKKESKFIIMIFIHSGALQAALT